MTTSTTRYHITFKKAFHTTIGIIAVAVAAAIGTGTGISSATTDAAGTTDALPSSDTSGTFSWSVEIAPASRSTASGTRGTPNRKISRIASTADNPWQPDATATTYQESAHVWTNWSGRTCYNQQYWDFYPRSVNLVKDAGFRLEADSTGTLFAYYMNDVWGYGRTALTPTG
ncbi:hypothetical protein R3Q06_32085 [Rhodococcus erythropolis]|uniref:hypothetical protein n=1 Tax=Rhodococcus erythropolis TaxID=1833 RepID=UPI00294980A4|nr:hypothetical protein [Rhodococcus erythropolis]MDV6278115.1 hypothetical protein [Rhodococcus erythropolis]